MFTVGEFARLAHVSKRLLRYYDEIDLLRPVRIDPATGYRYYSADQMSDLNRILALKELGLSLDQIRRMLSDHVSTDEMAGMLLLKKAEIEQQLRAELQKIQMIESRLQVIRSAENREPLNVIIKRIPATPVLSFRTIVPDFEGALAAFDQVMGALPDTNHYGLCFCICHSDESAETNLDMEIGIQLEVSHHATVMLASGLELQQRELPAVETMATTIVVGALSTIHKGYVQIAQWIEQNGYHLAGIPREITLQSPTYADGRDLITEIQVPVELMEI